MTVIRQRQIRALFKKYIKSYATRDARLTERFSDNFSGYTGGGDFIVDNKAQWIDITRLDFLQVPEPIRIEMLDLVLQDLSETVVVATALFHIHLPIPESTLSREAVRLTLIFRQEDDDWKIAHSGISVPYHLVQPGEVYPIKNLYDRNQELELLLKERTLALDDARRQLDALHQATHQVRTYLENHLAEDPDIETVATALCCSRRTLTRRLKEEGTNFLQVKNRLRRTVALQLLARKQVPVASIATQLGFADLTCFHRAFKQWTGITPRSYQHSASAS